MGKAENAQSEKLVHVPAGLAERYGWLGDMKASLKTIAENRERKVRAGEVVKETADDLARHYLRLAKLKERFETAISTVREGLRNLWAQQGLKTAEGITISPAIELQLSPDGVLAELAPDVATQVIRHEPVLDVEMLMALVKAGKVPQDVIGKHLRGKFDIGVRRA